MTTPPVPVVTASAGSPRTATAVAAVVLAGGRSRRMGADKAALAWHGSTLLYRTVWVLARAVSGPIVVVGSGERPLPPLPDPPGVDMVTIADRDPDRGPLNALGEGLAALRQFDAPGRRPVGAAFVCATDLPFLHPAVVRTVLEPVSGPSAPRVAVPVLEEHEQPLAAGYRVEVLDDVIRLLSAGERRLRRVLDGPRVRRITAAELAAVPAVAAADPGLASLRNVNTADDYRQALGEPAPLIELSGPPGRAAVRAHTWGELVEVLTVDGSVPRLSLNDGPAPEDPRFPVVATDRVSLDGHPGRR